MQCTVIKGGHPRCLVCTSTVSASGKPSPLHSPLDSDTPSVPSHLTPPFSPCALGAHGEDLAVDRPVAARCRSRYGGSRCTYHRLSSEPRVLQSIMRALCPGLLHWLVARASRLPIHVGQDARCVSWAAGWAQFRPGSRFQFKISFSILYSVSIEFKLQKFISKYPELQKLWNYICWFHNFLIYPIKLFSKTETFFLESILLKLE
jgi:hypothetical protein